MLISWFELSTKHSLILNTLYRKLTVRVYFVRFTGRSPGRLLIGTLIPCFLSSERQRQERFKIVITINWLIHSFHQGRFVNFSYGEYIND